MRTLGINGAGNVLYLAVAEDDRILDLEPYSVTEPEGLASDQRLISVRDRFKRILATHSVQRVRVLDAETQYKTTYAALRDRMAMETVALMASAESGVDACRLSRQKVKSLLGLTGPGALGTRVQEVTEPIGGHWARKRDLAALVALAGGKG